MLLKATKTEYTVALGADVRFLLKNLHFLRVLKNLDFLLKNVDFQSHLRKRRV